MDDLRLAQMAALSTSALEGSRGYLRAYEPLVQLSLLSELEAITGLSSQLADEVQAVSRLGLSTCQKNSDVSVYDIRPALYG